MRADDEARMALGTPEQADALRRAFEQYEDTILHRASQPILEAAMWDYLDALKALPLLPV